MKITVYENQSKMYYKLDGFDPFFEKALLRNEYKKENNFFIKSFQLPIPYGEKIIKNYKKYAEAMFFEETGYKQIKWQEGLNQLASIAKKSGIDWWTTGNILLPLNGIEADINDVDFIFNEKDVGAVYDAFQDHIVEPIIYGGSKADTYKYNGMAYTGCAVCMFAGVHESIDIPEITHFGKYAEANLLEYEWNGYKIKAPPIELYIKTLERWGKTERAQYIKNAIQHKYSKTTLKY